MAKYTVSYKSNRNVVYSCKYHVIWCPKYRRKVLIHLVCQEMNAEILELEIMSDHVHLLVEVDPQLGIHLLIKKTKGRSSRLLRQEFLWLRSKLPTLWTNSYFVSTVGGAPLQVVKQYIEDQKNV